MSRKYEEDERMQATNGYAVRSVRTVCLAAIVLVLAALAFASTANAAGPKKINPTQTYLAMGDSLAFGYSQQLFNENEKLGEPPTAFEHGYANQYWNKHKPYTEHIQLTNLGCPGETTDSLIGIGPIGAALTALAEAHGEEPCAYHYKLGLPLHHEYGGTPGLSQLESAEEQIAVDAGTAVPVTTLSLNIGANDELHQIAKCKAEITEEWTKLGKSPQYGGNSPEESFYNCITVHVKPLFEHILKNIGATLFTIREGSKFGSINYTGKIILLGSYDPYGNVTGSGEQLKGSVSLAKLLNQEEKKVAEKFGACFADPLPLFNPQNKLEPGRLQKWTNMANTTSFEGKANGPDIHPTPEGYGKLGSVMTQQCG
jgi:hypothetical protein